MTLPVVHNPSSFLALLLCILPSSICRLPQNQRDRSAQPNALSAPSTTHTTPATAVQIIPPGKGTPIAPAATEGEGDVEEVGTALADRGVSHTLETTTQTVTTEQRHVLTLRRL